MRRRFLIASLIAGVLACDESGDRCPNERDFRAGVYRSRGGQWSNGSGAFNHADVGPKNMALEHDVGGLPIVRITYQRAGKTIVETWRAPQGFFRWDWEVPPLSLKLDRVPRSEGAFNAGFGGTIVGQSRTQTFALSSIGTLTTPVAITVEGPAFTLERNGCDAFATTRMCTFAITFRPTSTTELTGRLKVTTLSPLFDLNEELFGRGL